jgi:hypothetical protein
VEWLLTDKGELIPIDHMEEFHRLQRRIVEVVIRSQIQLARSRELAGHARARVRAWRMWRQSIAAQPAVH